MDAQFKKDVIQWDVESWGLTLDFWQPYLNKVNGRESIAFGERGGGLTLWLASQGFKVTCTDLRSFPESTSKLHNKHKVSHLIEYDKQDVTCVNCPDNSYDVVAFKSIIGAVSTIENQQKAFDELYRILRPGGLLIFAENKRGTRWHSIARKKFTNWSSYWRYPTENEVLAMSSKFSECHLISVGFLAAFGRNEKLRNALSKLDKVLDAIIPDSWKYILIGVLRK